MKQASKTFDLKVSRTIPAAPQEVFDGWVDPRCPGTPWSLAKKVILDPKVDGLFYWLYINEAGEEKPHYGMFTHFARPTRLQYTWMSLHTRGLESIVTVTFELQGEDTLLTLRHENLPDDDYGQGHEKGWEFLLGQFAEHFPKSGRSP
jgi:uncharacterized protein YndB with AHSA1/START domain